MNTCKIIEFDLRLAMGVSAVIGGYGQRFSIIALDLVVTHDRAMGSI